MINRHFTAPFRNQRNMKPERVYLNGLNSSSTAYKVKVKVIEKGRAKVSPKKGILYQNLLLEDDKGNRMRGALFGDQVEGYKDAFVCKAEYEIANAPIKPVEEQYKSTSTDLDYQMNFGRHTVIQPINTEATSFLPEYQHIASIPKAAGPTDKFDILGVVLYVEEHARAILTPQGRENLVREIVIADHSTHQPLIISAWNDLAGPDCDRLSNWAAKFTVVGFTALKATAHKGFSLASTMSTTIIHDPMGTRANALTEWALRHKDTLADRQSRVLDMRNPPKDKQIMTICALKSKKPENTLQEERRWLRVVPRSNIDKLHAYLGCSHCGKRTDVPIDEAFTCPTCFQKHVISIPRVTFNCDVSDDTGTIPVTLFSNDLETLFRMLPEDIYRIRNFDDQASFSVIQQLISTSPFLIEVGPKITLSLNDVLQWILKRVELEDDPNAATTEHPPRSKSTECPPEQSNQANATTLDYTPVGRSTERHTAKSDQSNRKMKGVATSLDFKHDDTLAAGQSGHLLPGHAADPQE